MPFINIGDIDLNYEIHGEGFPLLFISGLAASTSTWEGQIGFFKDYYRCIVFDNRGAGLSGKPPGPYTIAQMAKDALARALPQALGAEPSSWVRALDRMLLMTQTRDQKQWHAMTTGPDVRQGNRIILPVMADSSTQIGRIPSSQVVNY